MGQTRQHAIAVQTSNPLPACVPAVLLLLQDVLRLCGITQLLDAALDGYNATILAYGQTGSGKTFTMSGEWGRGKRRPAAATLPSSCLQLGNPQVRAAAAPACLPPSTPSFALTGT
jgi:uncharacterized membrane protein